jgi:hypothetical protein
MLSYKEFYIWLEGYLYGKLENKHIDITPIVEKMDLVKEDNKIGISEPFRVPIPVNPFPIQDNPYKPPFEVYCNDKQQLND